MLPTLFGSVWEYLGGPDATQPGIETWVPPAVCLWRAEGDRRGRVWVRGRQEMRVKLARCWPARGQSFPFTDHLPFDLRNFRPPAWSWDVQVWWRVRGVGSVSCSAEVLRQSPVAPSTCFSLWDWDFSPCPRTVSPEPPKTSSCYWSVPFWGAQDILQAQVCQAHPCQPPLPHLPSVLGYGCVFPSPRLSLPWWTCLLCVTTGRLALITSSNNYVGPELI